MQDRVPLYPGRVTLTPVAGQANTYDMARADQPTQEGTPLNKATLLKDATAAKFGKDTGAVPDEVLDVLSAGVLHKPAQTKTFGKDLIKADFSVADNVSSPIDSRYAHGKFWIFKYKNVLETEDGENWKSHPLNFASSGYTVCETLTGFALFELAGTTTQVYFTTDFSSLDGPYTTDFTMTKATPQCVIYSALHNGFFATGQTSSGYGRIFFSADGKTWVQVSTNNITPIGFVIADDGKVYFAEFANSAQTYMVFAEITPTEMTYISDNLSPGSTYIGAAPYVLTYYDGAIYMILNGGVIQFDINAKKIKSVAVPSLSSYSIQALSVTNFAYKNKIASLFYFSSNVKLVLNEHLDNMAAADWAETGIILNAGSGQNAALAVNNDFSRVVIVSVAANDTKGVYYSADVYGPEVSFMDVLRQPIKVQGAEIETGEYTGASSTVSLIFSKKPVGVMAFPIEAPSQPYYGGLCFLCPPARKMAYYGYNNYNLQSQILAYVADLTVTEAENGKYKISWSAPKSSPNWAAAMCCLSQKYAYIALF